MFDEDRQSEQESVRRAAYRAAAGAVDRFLERVGYTSEGGVGDGSGARRLRAELARVVDLNLDLVRRAFDVYGSWIDDARDGSDHRLAMPAAVAGTTVSTIVWLHNSSDTERTDTRLVAGELGGSENGSTIPGSVWSFDPGSIGVPARSAAPVVASLALPAEIPPGEYTGTLTAIGLDGDPLTVSIEVFSRRPIGHDEW